MKRIICSFRALPALKIHADFNCFDDSSNNSKMEKRLLFGVQNGPAVLKQQARFRPVDGYGLHRPNYFRPFRRQQTL